MTESSKEKTYIDVKEVSLDQWLALLAENDSKKTFIDCEFPTDKHREEYVSRIENWSDKDIQLLLRKLLLPSITLGKDEFSMVWLVELSKNDPEKCRSLLNFTYYQRLLYHFKFNQSFPVWQGNTWVLDLLPHFPKEAIAALDAYALAHAQWLPDGRFRGTFDAIEVIRARYIGVPGTRPKTLEFLMDITPRMFECLVERLYHEMGYKTELTPRSSDGGRDIIALRLAPGTRESIRIECKHYISKPVGVSVLRSLLGVVSNERANKGAVVTTNRFTRGALKLAEQNSRLETISGDQLCLLLNEHLGPSWPLHIERIVAEGERRASVEKGLESL